MKFEKKQQARDHPRSTIVSAAYVGRCVRYGGRSVGVAQWGAQRGSHGRGATRCAPVRVAYGRRSACSPMVPPWALGRGAPGVAPRSWGAQRGMFPVSFITFLTSPDTYHEIR